MIATVEPATRLNPFPGLRPFEPDEDYLFFGREAQIDELLRRLRTTRFLAILGTSGSGKSSLVRSGLIPSLQGGAMTRAGSSWRAAILRPGDDPIGNLAAALAAPEALGGDDLQRAFFETTLRASKLGLVECVRQARLPARANVLVLADQFEELFRFKQSRKGSGHDEAIAFVKLLVEASRCPDLPLYVAFTMRSDFIGNCMELAELPEIVNTGLFLVPRMTRDELRSAITGPVAVGGAEISPRLVSRLLNDVGDNPDQLPILQHALMRTWDCWQQDHAPEEPLDLRHYEAVGTMSRALSQHAEEALAELDPEGRRTAETLFKALTEKGSDGRGIRRPAAFGEICSLAGGEAAAAAVTTVVERFRLPGRSFLMPPAGTPLQAGSVLDISHESLMRIWERLAGWVDEEARSAQVYLGVARAAASHAQGTAALWRDPELQVALTWRQEARPTEVWAGRYDAGFGRAMSFLDASEAARRREADEREAHRRSEQSQRLWRRLAWLLTAAAVVTLGFGAYALVMKGRSEHARVEAEQQRRNADKQRREALHQEGNAEAQRREAVRQSEIALDQRRLADAQSRAAVEQRQAADEQRQRAEAQQLVAQAKAKEANAARLEADGQRKEAQAEQVRADDLRVQADAAKREAERLNRLAVARTAALQVLRLPEDQDELAARVALRAYRLHLDDAGQPEEPAVFNALRAAVERRRLRQKLPPQPTWSDFQDAVRAVAVAPQGTALFAGSEDGRLRRLDLLHPGAPGTDLAVFSKGVRAVAVDAKGSLLAAGAADGSLRVLDLRAPGSVRELTGLGAPVVALAFSPRGTLLAVGRSDGGLALWDLAHPGALPRRLDGAKQITAISFDEEGTTLVAGLGSGGALLWNLREPSQPPKTRCAGKDVRSVTTGSFTNGRVLLVCGTAEGEIVIDPGGLDWMLQSLLGHRSSVTSLAFWAKNSNVALASASADHTVRLWNAMSFGAEPITLAGHSSWVWSVAFLPGGEQLVSAGADRTVRLWQARAKNLADELCRQVTPPLTREELDLFFDKDLPEEGGPVCPTRDARP